MPITCQSALLLSTTYLKLDPLMKSAGIRWYAPTLTHHQAPDTSQSASQHFSSSHPRYCLDQWHPYHLSLSHSLAAIPLHPKNLPFPDYFSISHHSISTSITLYLSSPLLSSFFLCKLFSSLLPSLTAHPQPNQSKKRKKKKKTHQVAHHYPDPQLTHPPQLDYRM